jgi:hypothetical protein
MPTLNIEGRKVKVDDSFLSLSPADQQATVEEIASQMGITSPQEQPKEASGYAKQAYGGLDSMLENFSTTAKGAGWQGTSEFLSGLTEKPEGYVSAGEKFINPNNEGGEGFNWRDLPGAAIEQSPQIIGSMGARGAGAIIGGGAGAVFGPIGAGVGAVGGALAGPAVFEFAQQIGPLAYERARNNGREEPNSEDWKAAAAGAGMSGMLNAIGIFGVGKLNSLVGIAKNVAKEGATEAGQSVVEQGTETIGTKKGAYIDVKTALGEGIIGGASAGGVDAVRNAKPMLDRGLDNRAVEKSIKNDPFAREKAEITDYVNQLSERKTQEGQELQSKEITSYARDIKNQAEELIKAQKLDRNDERALIKGLNSPEGLSEQRLNEIAGRSESPSEIKAIANRIQLIRSLTVQQQAHKGARGWLAQTVRSGGTIAGGMIGGYFGGIAGGAAGAEIGRNWSREAAQRITNAKTQGARIDAMIGPKQARRARLLLDRYGPSRATEAMNTLTERAAAKKAEADSEQQARNDFAATMARVREFSKMREKSRRAEQQAKTNEERAKARQEGETYKAAYREARLKAMALRAASTEARNKKLVQDLEAKKSMNALTIESTQVRNELQQKMAEAKSGQLDRQKQFEIENLKGKLTMLGLDIQKRQEALKKAQIATKRAEKTAQMAPKATASTLGRIRAMGAKWAKSVDGDENISNKPAYMSATEYLDGLRQQAQNTINAESNPEIRNLLRETLTDILSLKNNWDARRERFNRAMEQAKQVGKDAPQKLKDTLYQLAHYKAFSQSEGREDYGTSAVEDEDIPF